MTAGERKKRLIWTMMLLFRNKLNIKVVMIGEEKMHQKVCFWGWRAFRSL